MINYKSNKNIIITNDFSWITMWQIKNLIRQNAFINPHLRGLVSFFQIMKLKLALWSYSSFLKNKLYFSIKDNKKISIIGIFTRIKIKVLIGIQTKSKQSKNKYKNENTNKIQT